MSSNENFEMVSRLITNLEKKPLLEESSSAITKKSSKEEVAMWLEEEGFLVARDKLKGITGKELFSTSKEEFKKMIGFAESARLFSRLLKEKESLPEAEKTLKESDFQRFMRIRREDVDSRIPDNPITSFGAPSVPPKPTRPMIREVFIEPHESVKYVEKVKKSKEKPREISASKKTHNKQKEHTSRRDRKVRESSDSSEGGSEDQRRKHRHHKHSKEKKVRDKEEVKSKRDRHKRSHKSKQETYSDSETQTSSGTETPKTPPRRSKHKSKRRDKEKGKTQAKEATKEETDPVSPPPPSQQRFPNPLHPQMSPYGPVAQLIPSQLPPQYPPPFPDPYTNQLMVQQAQIARAEQERFAAEMRLRQLKSGFTAPGAMPFPPPMQHFPTF